MSYVLTITRNTTRPPRDALAHRVSLYEIGAEQPYALHQIGPVYNDVLTERGAYATRSEAVAAALDYVGAPVRLIEWRDNLGGTTEHRFVPLSEDLQVPSWVTLRTLGSNLPSGRYLAAEG